MSDLRIAAQQALEAEPLNLRDPAVQKRLATQWGYVPAAAQAEPVQDQRCRAKPRSDGDFVCDCKIGECPGRSAALAQQAEPVQEPVAYFGSAYVNENGVHITTVLGPVAIPQDAKLYTAPPQRKPLTEEEILAAVGWERAEMYMKLATNFPVDEAKQETLKNARAVERAHGIT